MSIVGISALPERARGLPTATQVLSAYIRRGYVYEPTFVLFFLGTCSTYAGQFLFFWQGQLGLVTWQSERIDYAETPTIIFYPPKRGDEQLSMQQRRDRSRSRETERELSSAGHPSEEGGPYRKTKKTSSINTSNASPCHCVNCSGPVENDRDWSVRYPGMTKEMYDEMMRVLDDPEYFAYDGEAVADCARSDDLSELDFPGSFEDSYNRNWYSPVGPPDVVPASPSELAHEDAEAGEDQGFFSARGIQVVERTGRSRERVENLSTLMCFDVPVDSPPSSKGIR